MTIQSREEHDKFVRRVWRICIVMAVAVFVVAGGIVAVLFASGRDTKKMVEISTTMFQVLMLSYGLGFFVPAFLTSLFKMSLGVEMSRKALEIGEGTAQIIKGIQNDVVPIIKDSQEVIGSVRELVSDLKSQNPKKIVEFIDKLATDGTVDRLAASIERIAAKAHEVIEKIEKKSIDSMIDKL